MTPQEQHMLRTLTAGLCVLTTTQGAGASRLPAHLQPLDEADFRSAILLTFTELGELMNDARAKAWRNYAGPPTPEERARLLDEFADVLHGIPWMMRNLMERFDLTEADFAAAFLRKAKENEARFEGRVPGREPPADLSPDVVASRLGLRRAPGPRPVPDAPRFTWTCRKCGVTYTDKAQPTAMNGSRGSDCRSCSGWPPGTDAEHVVTRP